MYGVYVGSLLLLASEGATLRSVQSRIAKIYIFFFICQFCPLTISMRNYICQFCPLTISMRNYICQFCPLTVSMSGLNVSRYKRRAPWGKWWLVKMSNSKNGCRCTTQIGMKCLGCNVLMGAHSTHDKV